MKNIQIPTLNGALSLLVILVIITFIFGFALFISIAALSAFIVPLTYLYGLATGQSYDRVCDNSEILYKLNQLGKWALVVLTATGFVYLLFHYIF